MFQKNFIVWKSNNATTPRTIMLGFRRTLQYGNAILAILVQLVGQVLEELYSMEMAYKIAIVNYNNLVLEELYSMEI